MTTLKVALLAPIPSRPHPDPFGARALLQLFDPSKLPARCLARFFGQHPGGQVTLDQAVEVLPNFFIHLCLMTRPLHKSENPAPPTF